MIIVNLMDEDIIKIGVLQRSCDNEALRDGTVRPHQGEEDYFFK